MMGPCHMSHSASEGHNHSVTSLIDPVCGKQIGEENSITYEYKNNTYHFDNEQCLSVFKSNPEHFLQKQNHRSHNENWNKAAWIGGAFLMTAMMVIMLVNVI